MAEEPSYVTRGMAVIHYKVPFIFLCCLAANLAAIVLIL